MSSKIPQSNHNQTLPFPWWKTLAFPERAEIVKLRFFAGFGEAEIASLLDMSERSVQRHWHCAKAWLFERIETMKAD